MRVNFKIFLPVVGLAAVLMGGSPTQKVSLLYPTLQDSTSYDQGQIFIVSAQKDTTGALLVSTEWRTLKQIDLTASEAKDEFPKTFLKLFEPHTTIKKIWFTYKFTNYFTTPESVAYKYGDTMTIRRFWRTPEFAGLLKEVQNTSPLYVVMKISGWKDSSYVTPYDDPNDDNRKLYKLHLRLVPGLNLIYFAPAGRKDEALEFTTNYVNESKSLDTRSTHFHNSEFEKNCTTCHEGLPSADNGMTMKADCSVCHTAPPPELKIHGPVEMKQCDACHGWSGEKKVMLVTKGVPDACYECHSDKKTAVDSSKSVHPIASDCITCHSPHSSDQPHLLKTNVYDLCTGCHADQKLNHPVGKHPMRFALTRSGEEISCVSCHNPHGTDNDHLLKVAGGSMAVCAKCH